MIGRWCAEAPRCAVLPLHAVTAFEHGSNHRLPIDPEGADDHHVPRRGDERGAFIWTNLIDFPRSLKVLGRFRRMDSRDAELSFVTTTW
jgi:hypothetical protein